MENNNKNVLSSIGFNENILSDAGFNECRTLLSKSFTGFEALTKKAVDLAAPGMFDPKARWAVEHDNASELIDQTNKIIVNDYVDYMKKYEKWGSEDVERFLAEEDPFAVIPESFSQSYYADLDLLDEAGI